MILLPLLQLAWICGCLYLIGEGLNGHGFPNGKRLAMLISGIVGLAIIAIA